MSAVGIKLWLQDSREKAKKESHEIGSITWQNTSLPFALFNFPLFGDIPYLQLMLSTKIVCKRSS
jgi:hypothetical protein